MAARKPKYSWAEYLAANPDTKHDAVTYCAGDFTLKEAGRNATVGHVFNCQGSAWRIVRITAHPFSPVKVVPACWPENYGQGGNL